MKIPMLVYTCPNCRREVHLPYIEKPLKCTCCQQVMCPKCKKGEYCPRCFNSLTPDERQQMLSIDSDHHQSERGMGFACVLIIISALPIFLGIVPFIFHEEPTPSQSIILFVGILILFLGIVWIHLINRKTRRLKVTFEESKGRFNQIIQQRLFGDAKTNTFSNQSGSNSILQVTPHLKMKDTTFLEGGIDNNLYNTGGSICNKCGRQNEVESKFCGSCGDLL